VPQRARPSGEGGMPVQNRLITKERVEPGVAKIVLNNPPLNLVTLELTEQLIEAIDGLERDNSVRVVIITGAGSEAFCAGSDVKEFPAVREQIVEKRLARENQAFSNIEFLPKPVIAAIEGVALGSGFEMSLACDIRIVAEDARIGSPRSSSASSQEAVVCTACRSWWASAGLWS
jgi:enoyl-CoA hydratase